MRFTVKNPMLEGTVKSMLWDDVTMCMCMAPCFLEICEL